MDKIKIGIPRSLFYYYDGYFLKNFFEYSRNISFAYYSKTKNTFFKQFSLISYNPYMFPKYLSNSITISIIFLSSLYLIVTYSIGLTCAIIY